MNTEAGQKYFSKKTRLVVNIFFIFVATILITPPQTYAQSTGSISGCLWLDVNQDGTRAGATEEALGSWEVSLYQNLNAPWKTAPENSAIETIMAGSDGCYRFEGLSAGIYQVFIKTPTGWAGTFPPLTDDHGLTPSPYEGGNVLPSTLLPTPVTDDTPPDDPAWDWVNAKLTNNPTMLAILGESWNCLFFQNCQLAEDSTLRNLRYYSVSVEEGATIEEVNFGTIDLPPTVSNVLVSSTTPTSAIISWTTDKVATSQIEYGATTSYGKETNTSSAQVTTHQQTLTRLLPNTEYHFRVRSADTHGNYGYSIDSTFRTAVTDDTTAPEAVSVFTAEAVGHTSITLRWEAPYDASGISTYDIHQDIHQLSEDHFVDGDTTHLHLIETDSPEDQGVVHTYQVVGLSPGTTYYFAMRVLDPYQNTSLLSPLLSVTTTFESSPSTGSGGGGGAIILSPLGSATSTPVQIQKGTTTPQKVIDVEAIGLDHMIVLTWKNPTDANYVRTRILRSESTYPENPLEGNVVYDGNATTFGDAKLTNGKTFYYSIFTYDQDSKYSEPVKLSLAPYAERRHYHVLDIFTFDAEHSSITLSKDLMRGDTDDEVGHVQELLAVDPTLYPQGLVTGYFGPLTEAAVKKLQEKAGIPVTGRVDGKTRDALLVLPHTQALSEQTTPGIVWALAHDLSLGMRNENVKVLQQYLIEQDYLAEGNATGLFGPLTRGAVMEFQKAKNITPVSGYVGPLTRSKILEGVLSIPGPAL